MTLRPTGEDSLRWRAQNLIDAAEDIDRASGIERETALSGRHRTLWNAYRRELREAEHWAKERRRTAVRLGDDPAMSPVAARLSRRSDIHPYLVHVVRDYWLRTTALNEQLTADERIRPEQFLLGELLRSGDDDLVALVVELPYWPIGLDADGHWM